VFERMTEKQILDIDAAKDVANCSVTSYALGTDADGRSNLVLTGYNFVAPLEESQTPVTKAPDVGPA
jgi:hypothetical protein